MKAIISDIHGNLPALEAVLEDIDKKEITEIVCLGDVVGYGPYPRECLEKVKPCDTIILGNHEEAVLYEAAAATFNSRARRAVNWTRAQLFESLNGETQESIDTRRQFLESFLQGTNVEGIQYVHASPRSPTREYITPKDARNKRKMKDIFEALEWVCFVGHTHVPGVFTENDFSPPHELLGNIYLLDPDEKALLNVGSVGQPRDGDPRACYVTFDGEGVRFCRVKYDLEKTISKIQGIKDLDNFLGQRLREGK